MRRRQQSTPSQAQSSFHRPSSARGSAAQVVARAERDSRAALSIAVAARGCRCEQLAAPGILNQESYTLRNRVRRSRCLWSCPISKRPPTSTHARHTIHHRVRPSFRHCGDSVGGIEPKVGNVLGRMAMSSASRRRYHRDVEGARARGRRDMENGVEKNRSGRGWS